ncbi:IMPACT family protein [Murdochiella massiliensis]|uniref:IMPACT family protein n=1 Tax=Murdochiella massiliensis TaxID=1673723 RepID=UPI0008366A6A|nr:YigZ family protein [Murdochiella massiliensis]
MSYRSLLRDAEVQFTIKKSQFLGYARRVKTVEEADAVLQEIRAAHPSATHHCSAYILGHKGVYQKADDDGEPQGTAGLPMLEVLRREKLDDVLVVVVRYFGGIKLGAPGLVRAYTKACSNALQSASPVFFFPFRAVTLTYAYPVQGKCDYALRNYRERTRTYGENVTVGYWLPVEEIDKIRSTLLNLTSGQIEWIDGDEVAFPTDEIGRPVERK